MTIDIQQDLESKIRRYPQIVERLPRLLEQQVALEQWREKRYSDQARAIVDQVFAVGEASSDDADFARLEAAFADMLPHLGPTQDD